MKPYKAFFLYLILTLIVSKSGTLMAQAPPQTIQAQDYFKQVDQLVWVVKDLDQVVNKWRQLGFDQVIDFGTVEASEKKSGQKIKLKMAQANLGGAIISWIQPLETKSLFAQFNNSYGDGAMSLVYHLNSEEDMQKEVQRLKGIGMDEWDEVAIITPSGTLDYVFMNTRQEGKYVLGYTFGDVDKTITASLTGKNKFAMRQNAFVARDPEPISNYWQKAGMPPLTMAKPDISDKMYHGTTAGYDLKQGWQKQGKIPYEWCFSLRAPNVYLDHLKQHGEGIHHLGFAVKDMDEVIRDYESKGFHFSMSGSWGEKGKPGSGRFAYVDLEDAGGVTMELLWNYVN
jgi:methylmalonyl-CoA/ethylmalonyl-CoA epimerase